MSTCIRCLRKLSSPASIASGMCRLCRDGICPGCGKALHLELGETCGQCNPRACVECEKNPAIKGSLCGLCDYNALRKSTAVAPGSGKQRRGDQEVRDTVVFLALQEPRTQGEIAHATGYRAEVVGYSLRRLASKRLISSAPRDGVAVGKWWRA